MATLAIVASFVGITTLAEAGDRSGSGAPRGQTAKLSPGKTLVLELNALSGKRKLPRKYRKLAKVPSAVVLANLAARYRTLSTADRAAVRPFFLQPRYKQSAWSVSSRPRSHPAAHASDTDPCAGLESVSGGWNGIETPHAWFWYRASGRGRAQALSGEFTRKIWPTLTGAFKTVDDSAASECDPVGDSKLDIYLTPPGNTVLKTAGGVAPVIPVGDACGPLPSFVIVPETATRWTLAHEFMHTIQWAYKACERHAAWVEGTATWAGDYVYKNDHDEHRWKTGLTAPFLSMLAGPEGGYEAWTFWYSLAKREKVDAVKRVFDALATRGFASALEAGPSDGLREAWKRYAVERWNAAPIGTGGFPVAKSFKSWDRLTAKPGGVPEAKVAIGAAKTKTFELNTSTQGPLSTWYDRVTITDAKVRHVKFENADYGKDGSLVQAFVKLANGKWRLEDWSGQDSASFCRDKPNENVVELVIASSNASADGPPIGVVKHKVVAKDRCGLPVQFDGTWTRIFTDTSRGSWQITINGSATFIRRHQEIDTSSATYAITNNTVSWTASGSQDIGDGCSFTFSGGGSDSAPDQPPTELSLEDVTDRPEAPKPEPKPFYYSIWVHGNESGKHEYDVTSACPSGSDTYKDQVPLPYLQIGFRDWWTSNPPEIMKSAEVTPLEGHRTRTSSSTTIDDTWHFTATG